jgi:uncharacterized protein YabN with tetrapyrrole methylase and pyrophosphatase domain
LIEEAHEASAAIRSGHASDAVDELGDLLFMVFFLVHLYEEKGTFQLETVCDAICEKMIRRHPHVFGNATVESDREVRQNWEKIKAGEKAANGHKSGGIPESLPALMRAYRMISRLSGEDDAPWNDVPARTQEFVGKCQILGSYMVNGSTISAKAFGEIFLDLVNLARLKGYRAEDCLHEELKDL